MFSLVLSIIGIALFAAVTATTLNYIPAEAHMRQLLQLDAERGLKSLENSTTRYLDANRDVNGNIVYPGAGINLVSAVTPAYGFLPAAVRKEMTWDVETGSLGGMPAVGICLKPIGSSTTGQRVVLLNLQAKMPVGSTFVAPNCYATSNTGEGSHLTYWLPLAHIN